MNEQDEIDKVLDEWFYKYTTKEPDNTETLVLHETYGWESDAKPDLLQAITTLLEQSERKARIETANILWDKLYDITDIDWGIPTKWSVQQFNKEHADLWIPQCAVADMIKNYINQLTTKENK